MTFRAQTTFIANWILAVSPVVLWLYYLVLRNPAWEGQFTYFFYAWLTLLGASAVGIFRVTYGELLAARIMYSFLWLFTIIPISWFLGFCASISGTAIMP